MCTRRRSLSAESKSTKFSQYFLFQLHTLDGALGSGWITPKGRSCLQKQTNHTRRAHTLCIMVLRKCSFSSDEEFRRWKSISCRRLRRTRAITVRKRSESMRKQINFELCLGESIWAVSGVIGFLHSTKTATRRKTIALNFLQSCFFLIPSLPKNKTSDTHAADAHQQK